MILPAGLMGPKFQPLVSAFSTLYWNPCCRIKNCTGNNFVASKLLKIE